MGKKVVGIAMGGHSSEREISLKSGQTVYENLSPSQWEVCKIIVDKNHWIVADRDGQTSPLDLDDFTFKIGGKTRRLDVLFNAIHGAPGENGELAKKLENGNIPQTGCDSHSAALTFDKRACLEKVKTWNIPVAASCAFDRGDAIDPEKIIEKVGLPCFVKPNRSGSSFGIVKVYHKKDFEKAIHTALKEDSELLIESALVGKEISVGAYNDRGKIVVLPITEIISENDFFDYDAKYNGKSQEITPAKLDEITLEKVQTMVKKIYQNLELKGICRSEFILVDGIPHLLEVNTIPGLTTASLIPQQLQAAGIPLAKFFETLLTQALITAPPE
jgi:D-alanine-D-alanine ligase